MFPLKDKLTKIIYDTSSNIFSFSDNIICDCDLVMAFNILNFLRLLKDILMQIGF